MNQNHQLWVSTVSVDTLNFKKLFRDSLCIMRDLPLVKISANLSHIRGRKGPETPQKVPLHGCCIAMKTFENLKLDNHKCYTNETRHDYVPP